MPEIFDPDPSWNPPANARELHHRSDEIAYRPEESVTHAEPFDSDDRAVHVLEVRGTTVMAVPGVEDATVYWLLEPLPADHCDTWEVFGAALDDGDPYAPLGDGPGDAALDAYEELRRMMPMPFDPPSAEPC